jgi:hypothetical protein
VVGPVPAKKEGGGVALTRPAPPTGRRRRRLAGRCRARRVRGGGSEAIAGYPVQYDTRVHSGFGHDGIVPFSAIGCALNICLEACFYSL